MRCRRAVVWALVMVTAASPLWIAGIGRGAAPPVTIVEGTIDSVAADVITVTAAAGSRTRVMTTPATRVLSREPARAEDISKGDFIGVAAKKDADGSLTAVDINIFPPALRGQIRESQFPMASGNIMTNAVVTEYVTAVAGRTLSLAYAGETATINVPPQATVHRLMLATLGDLKTGLRIVARGTANADGSISAAAITIEK